MLGTRTIKKKKHLFELQVRPIQKVEASPATFQIFCCRKFGVKTLVLQGSLFDTKPKQCTMNLSEITPKKCQMHKFTLLHPTSPLEKKVNL